MSYDYTVSSARVVDGDTAYLTVDLGFRASLVIDCRLDGWDCPEKRSSATRKITPWEASQAVRAQQLAQAWLAAAVAAGQLRVATKLDPEKYGRYLGDIYTAAVPPDLGVKRLGDALSSAQLAVPYDGTSRTKRWYQVYDQPGAAS